MKRLHTLALFMFVFGLAATAGAQTKVDLENRPDGPLGTSATPLTIAVKKDGKPAAGVSLTVAVSQGQLKKTEDADDKLKSDPLTVTTDSNGTARVTIKPADKTKDVKVTVTPAGEEATTFAWTLIGKFDVDATNTGPIEKHHVYQDAIVITAKGADGSPASFERMRVAVTGGADALLFQKSSDARKNPLPVVTDDAGFAKVSVETLEDTDFAVSVEPIDADSNAVVVGEKTVQLSPLRQFDTFHSSRLYSELFMGATFTNDYDADGNSTGFKKTSPLVRLTLDTLWTHRSNCDPSLSAKEEEAKAKPNKKEKTGKRRKELLPCMVPSGTIVPGSLWHTGVDMEVSSFPFGTGQTDSNNNGAGTGNNGGTGTGNGGDPDNLNASNGPKGLDTAFTGTLFTVYQPDWLASYTKTSQLTGFPTDALRLGFLGKFGMTTRQTADTKNGDTEIWRAQVGLRLTHHQTKADLPYHEQDNIVPIRFIEVSYGKFEEFAGHRNANRLVIDAGLRLPGLGSNQIPFYAGIHINGGRGPDDLRIFAGFLFKINELATLFQGGTPK